MEKLTPIQRTVLNYGMAIIFVAVAMLLRWALVPVMGGRPPYITVYLAVVCAAAFGGLGPGLFATALGAVAGVLLLRSAGEVPLTAPAELVRLGLLLASGVGISMVAGRMRQAVGQLAEEVEKARLLTAEAAAARQAAERASSAKDHFLAVLSHELRTPLAPVSAAAQILGGEASLSPDQRELVETIRRNVELEARLIDDLLDLTRVSRGKVELNFASVDVHERIRQAVEMVASDAAAKQLNLAVRAEARHQHVQADAARLQQVLWNLLKNASKFTPIGGSIVVQTENPEPGRLAVSVTDTGVGIDAEALPRVFDAFEQGGKDVTRQFGGLGLGLAISKGLTEMHGGTLTAHSDGPGKGATFTLMLPTSVVMESKARPECAPGQAMATEVNHCLLLVEDHADTAKLMARLLRAYGYEVVVADTLAGALRAAEAQPFSLVVSDIGLPDGNGLDLMRQLKARHGLSGIALSGFGMERDIRESREAGFDAHLTKPVNLQLLEETVRRLLTAA